MNHITSKLPREVLVNVDIMGGLKEKLYNYFNQNYQNMFNRYIVTTEDEMLKKIRDFIDREEMKVLTRYTPKEIASLLASQFAARVLLQRFHHLPRDIGLEGCSILLLPHTKSV